MMHFKTQNCILFGLTGLKYHRKETVAREITLLGNSMVSIDNKNDQCLLQIL